MTERRSSTVPGLAGIILAVLALAAAVVWAALTLTAAIVSSLTIGLAASGTALLAAALGYTSVILTHKLRQEDENR